MKDKYEMMDDVWDLARELMRKFTYSLNSYFYEILDVITDCTDTPDHLHEAKIKVRDLTWTMEKLKEIKLLVNSKDDKILKKLQDDIMSDKRWKHYEVGRVYLTRYDCCIVPEGVWRTDKVGCIY